MNMGNPKRASRFLCLKCLHVDTTYIPGIQRTNQRSKYHIKDSVCLNCGEVKTMEVRYNDYLPEIMGEAIIAHNKIYNN